MWQVAMWEGSNKLPATPFMIFSASGGLFQFDIYYSTIETV